MSNADNSVKAPEGPKQFDQYEGHDTGNTTTIIFEGGIRLISFSAERLLNFRNLDESDIRREIDSLAFLAERLTNMLDSGEVTHK